LASPSPSTFALSSPSSPPSYSASPPSASVFGASPSLAGSTLASPSTFAGVTAASAGTSIVEVLKLSRVFSSWATHSVLECFPPTSSVPALGSLATASLCPFKVASTNLYAAM